MLVPPVDELFDDARDLIGRLDRREVGAGVELVHREPGVRCSERALRLQIRRIVGLRIGVEDRDWGSEGGEARRGLPSRA